MKLMKKLNHYLTEENDSSHCLKILTQRSRRFAKEKRTNPSITNLPWKASLPFTVFFYKDQWKKDGLKPDTVPSFQNNPALHWRAKTCSAVSFDRMNFFQHGAFDFTFTESLCYDCYCFREPINTLFFEDCQMTVKSRILHLFPVPQTGSHIINILLASFSWSAL